MHSPGGRVEWVAVPVAVLLGWLVALDKVGLLVPVALGGVFLLMFRFRLGSILGLFSFVLLVPPVAVSPLGPQSLLLAGELTVAMGVILSGHEWRVKASLLWVGLAFVAAIALAALRGSPIPDTHSHPILGAVTIGTQIMLVVAGSGRYSDDSEIDEMMGGLSLVGLALAGWALLEFVLDRGLAYPLVSGARRAVGPFGNPNYFGALLALIAVLCLGGAVNRWHERRRPLLPAASAASCAAGVLATLSRGALLGLVAGAAVVVFRTTSGRRRRSFGVLVLIASLGVGLLAWNQITKERFGLRSGAVDIQTVVQAEEMSLRARYLAAKLAVDYALESPLQGIGLDGFAYAASRDSRFGEYLNTHNEPLRIAAEAGLPAFALLVLFTWIAAGRVLRRGPGVVNVALPTLASYGVISLFLNGLENALLSFPVVVILFLAVGNAQDARSVAGDTIAKGGIASGERQGAGT